MAPFSVDQHPSHATAQQQQQQQQLSTSAVGPNVSSKQTEPQDSPTEALQGGCFGCCL